MKYFIIVTSLLLAQVSSTVFAETEEEEMARIQKQMNNRVFGLNKEPKPVVAEKPEIVKPVETAAATEPVEDTGSIPLSKFTSYKLAGLSLGKEEQAVLDTLKSQGYNCDMQQMAAITKMTGKKVCIYLSGEDPKMAMIGFSGGKLHDLETNETYTTGFPEKFFKKAKAKFIKKYGTEANCKAKGKGEICEVFGHGYRVLFRTEIKRNDKATIVNRIAKM